MRTGLLENSSLHQHQAQGKTRIFSRFWVIIGKPGAKRILFLPVLGLLSIFFYSGLDFASQPENGATLEVVEQMDAAAVEAASAESPGAAGKAASAVKQPEGEFEDFNVVLARIEAEHARLAAMEQNDNELESGSTDTLVDIPDSLNDQLPAVAEMKVESSAPATATGGEKRQATILKKGAPGQSNSLAGKLRRDTLPPADKPAGIKLNPTPPSAAALTPLNHPAEGSLAGGKTKVGVEIDLSEEAERSGKGIFSAAEAGKQGEADAAVKPSGQVKAVAAPAPISTTGAAEQEQMNSKISERAAEQIRRQRLLKKMRQVEAGRKMEAAEQLAEAGDNESALKLMEDAERLDPESTKIARRVRELRALVEKGGQQSVIESTLNRARIAVEVSAMQVDRQLDEAESLLLAARSESEEDKLLQPGEKLNRSRGQVMNALKALDTADALLEGSMMALASRSEKRQKSATLREELIKERSRIDEKLRALSIARAQSEVAAAKKEYDESITRKINSMMKSAEYHIARREYPKAVEITDQIIKMYPEYKPAWKLRDQARTLNFNTRDDDIQRRLQYSEEQSSLDVNEMAIAESAAIIYPENWEELKLRRTVATKVEASEDWKRKIQHKLENTKISLDFEAIPLEDILIFIREQGDINLLWDRTVDLQQEITITVNNMTLGPALDWVLELCTPPLHKEMRDQALYISTEPRSDVEIKLYPVFDITKAVNDYYGEGGFGGTTGTTTGSDTSTGDIFGSGDDDDTTSTGTTTTTTTTTTTGGITTGGTGNEAAIVEDIRNVIAGNWDTDPRVSVDVWNDQLLVVQTPQVQQQIEKYLQDLRANMKQQVLVDGRFLQVVENFLEEIGFAWTGPLDNTATAFPPGGSAGLWEALPTLPSGFMQTSTTSSQGLGKRGLLSGLSIGQATDLLTAEGGINLAYKYISSEPLHAYEVNAILDAVRRNQKGSILHNPRLLVGNGRHAYMRIETTSDYISDADVENGYVTPVISQVEQGVVFNVRPVISFDKKYITLRLRPQMTEWDAENTVNRSQTILTRTQGNENADTDFGTVPITIPQTFPAIKTTTIQTTVTVPTGGTILIGGHMSDTRLQNTTGVPFLSDLPFFGRLTRHESLERKKSNLILMIGAKIIELDQ